MRIEIDIPRPFTALFLIAGVGYFMYTFQNGQTQATVTPTVTAPVAIAETGAVAAPKTSTTNDYTAEGGDTTPTQRRVASAEDDMRLARAQQAVISNKAEILRGELTVLDEERQALGSTVDPALETQFHQSNQILVSLIQDQKKAEQFLLASLNQIWEAQGRAQALGEGLATEAGPVEFQWPVDPIQGISATFKDASYKTRFGFDHDAIDIPTPQMTIVRAAADGTVKDVIDHGLGFNYITIKHAAGMSTLYGHITKFIVQPGDRVSAGDPIGYSGGRPGSPGAGFSTGPHLHFGVYQNGAVVDPQEFLPVITGVTR